MNLKNYFNQKIKAGLLKKDDIGLDQVKALLGAAGKNLIAAEKNINIDEETCYSMAYSAMLKTARAIIYLNGMRPDDGQQHKTTVEAAGKILGNDFKELIVGFDKMRRKRNEFTYNPLVPVGKQETRRAMETAERFMGKVKYYLEKNDPQKKLL